MAGGARTVLITGCNRGIGQEMVKQLLAKPSAPKQIFATCRDPKSPTCKKLNELAAKHPGLHIIQLEATDKASVEKAAQEVKALLNGTGLNVVFNNAGIMPSSTLESIDAGDLLHVYKTNLVGPLQVTKAFLPLLKKAAKENPQSPLGSSRALLVNMSTIGSSISMLYGFDSLPVVSYRCSKAALNMLTRCQAHVYKADGILCAAMHPGWVSTELGGEHAEISVDESVRGILNVLDNLNEKKNGLLVDWKGETIPW